MSALTDADLAFYLLRVIVCLSVCLVWALREIDQRGQKATPRRKAIPFVAFFFDCAASPYVSSKNIQQGDSDD
jgi:hypothetical protein